MLLIGAGCELCALGQASPRGARAIAVGASPTRTWRADDGGERSRLEIVADEVGPSLRWATAQITKTPARG